MPPLLTKLLFSLLFFGATQTVVLACATCGKSSTSRWNEIERLPKASQLHPQAQIVEYTLDITEERLALSGNPVRVLAVNGSIPGPTLRFHEGDVARIHVRNRLKKDETSLHWHGLLVPNLEDGVPNLTTPPITPGTERTFEFLLKHSGTYWYHSHTGLQEQRGVYGSIVIEPKKDAPVRTDLPRIDREEVIVLSDWTNENANNVMRSLLRGSDWYAIRKGTVQSLVGAIQVGHLKDYLNREKSRLPPMDVSDVAYDAFLINGKSVTRIPAHPGQTVRLRVINAAASTYFYLSAATGPLTVIAADGMDVTPIRQQRLLIGMAETYDVLVTIPDEPAAWEIRATAQDNSGHTSLFLGEGAVQVAPAPGSLNPYSMNAALATVLEELDESGTQSDEEALATESDRPLPPYKRLKAIAPTTLPENAPIREVTLKLTGDMTRYLWSIDGKPIDEQSTIPVKRGEVLRLTLVNNTMMHHPMHLHGHFFRLLMPDAVDPAYAPLKHTVDVPPMSRRVIEFYANEDRDWLFHCHLLFHMKSGMARVVSYTSSSSATPLPATGTSIPDSLPTYRPNLGEHAMPHTYAWLDANVQSHMSSGMGTVQRGRHNLNLTWKTGWERIAHHEYEIEATASYYFNPLWTAFVGYRLTNMMDGRDGAIAGANYRLPYFVDFTSTLHSADEARFALSKQLQLTSRIRLSPHAVYDTAENFSWSCALSYTLSKHLSVISSFDSDYGLGAGIVFRL